MMLYDRNRILVESIRRLLRRKAMSHLKKIVNKTHAADLAFVFPSLTFPDQRILFNFIEDIETKAAIFSYLSEDDSRAFIDEMSLEEVVSILEHMPTDDVADLIGILPQETADAILNKMKIEGSQEVQDLLRYEDDTAGGIMTPDFIVFRENITAAEAIASLQKEHVDVEMPFYLYIVDDSDRLVGVSSLRQLVVVPSETPLKDFMTTQVISVRTDTDQEEVAKIVARYDILAVPVVDEFNQLVGIVTVDDVIDIIREEATEDILRMAGAGEEFVETQTVLRSIRIRLPWLLASCFGGIVAFFIIGKFEASLNKFAYLAAFIPVIMGMGGNIGTQSSTIVVRGLATGRIATRNFWSIIMKELMIGLILGLFYGLLVGAVAEMRFFSILLAISVSLAVLSSMSVAAFVGALVPLVFAKAKIDPAVATGPFVTTAIDIISVYCYFAIATTLLEL
jgi:magnesium transporter